jgi:hypothetical protein
MAVATTSRTWLVAPDVLVGRLLGAGLLGWMAWIHLHRWSQGYKHVPTIGNLFLLNFIAGVLLGLAVLIVPGRLLPFASAAGTLMAAGTLGALAISINVGLFGFTDSFDAPFVHLSIWVEGAAVIVLAATTIRSAALRR